jgi:hypothetical protein
LFIPIEVVRKVGETDLYIKVSSFWQVPSTNVLYVEGIIYKQSQNVHYTFSVLLKLFSLKYVKYDDLYHINDFVYKMDDNDILIKSII